MKLASVKLGLLGFGLLFVFALVDSRADDFEWNAQAGPPQEKVGYACDTGPDCLPDTLCHNITPVSMIPDGETQSVVVKSYKRVANLTYGNCVSFGENDKCYQYPGKSAPCGKVAIYGKADCDIDAFLGGKTVYAGNCTP